MRARLLLAFAALLLAVALAGCGGGGGGEKLGGTGGAGLVGASDLIPASAPIVVAVNTDFEGGQGKTLQQLLDKFPGRQKLYDQVAKSFGTGEVTLDDLKGALGPETDVAFLDTKGGDKNPDLVALTQPKDEAKFEALLAKSKDKPVTEKVGDWTVIADTQALIDRFKSAGAKLSADTAYKEAVSGLPEERLATVYLTGEGLKGAVSQQNQQASSAVNLDWLAFSANATDDGIGIDLRFKGPDLKGSNFASRLLDQVPAGALAAAVFRDGGFGLGSIADLPQLKQLAQQTGVTTDQLTELFRGDGILLVRSGVPLPEITIAVTKENPGSSLTTLDTIVSKLSKTPPTTEDVPGVGSVKKVSIEGQPIAIYYGTVSGKLIVSTATSGFTALANPAQKLSDDEVFKEVKDLAGLPDDNAGFLYLNFKDLVPLILGLAQAANQKIDPAVSQNLGPLRALLLYATADGDTFSARGFLQIK